MCNNEYILNVIIYYILLFECLCAIFDVFWNMQYFM